MREAAIVLMAMAAAGLLTWLVRRHALAQGMLDIPNARSSHTQPTPRGGGLAIVATILAGTALVAVLTPAHVWALGAMLAAGAVVASIGYVDDRRGVPASRRFAVHTISACLFTAAAVPDGGAAVLPALPAAVVPILLVLGLVWSVNLFNFMDGIDGIAASQAIFVAAASAGLVLAAHGPAPDVLVLLITAGACAGFLIWNWPKAAVFMGDVGSGFLGFWLAALAIVLAAAGLLSLWTSIVLGVMFSADATVTLLRRVVAGERWYEPHRSHAYQHQARRWSHRPVTLALWAVNLGVVLPLAAIAEQRPAAAPWIAAGVLATIGSACWVMGAGRAGNEPEARGAAINADCSVES